MRCFAHVDSASHSRHHAKMRCFSKCHDMTKKIQGLDCQVSSQERTALAVEIHQTVLLRLKELADMQQVMPERRHTGRRHTGLDIHCHLAFYWPMSDATSTRIYSTVTCARPRVYTASLGTQSAPAGMDDMLLIKQVLYHRKCVSQACSHVLLSRIR